MARPRKFPAKTQAHQPGDEYRMEQKPEVIRQGYIGSGKLEKRIALITGGDSGIGRAVAVHFAREGADIAIVYLEEEKDARETKEMVEAEGRRCILIKGDAGSKAICKRAVKKITEQLGRINILVNNAAEQHPEEKLEDISADTFDRTFKTNIYSYFYFTREVVSSMKKGDSIINTTSVTAYRGSDHLIDYSATKGAIVSFTRSLGKNLAKKGIRVNAVAPGPIWTPLIVSTFKKVSDFGQDTPAGRAGQPSEVAPAYVFLASEDASYIMGQVIHVNGGEVVGG